MASSYENLLAELYDIPKDKHGRYRSDYVFRGLDVGSWSLQTSLQRLGTPAYKVENALLRNFIKYSIDDSLAQQPLLYQLAFAQHHGLPTRVLDWTTAPKIALHFAVGDEAHFHEDGVIWAVDIVRMRATLAQELQDILQQNEAFLFSVDMLKEVESFSDLDRRGSAGNQVIFFEPPSLDSRIVNQAAILSVATSNTLNFEDFLSTHSSLCRKIVVPANLKWEIRDKLDQDQINERMLFPGEDGTARWLKRYYGPGPNVRTGAPPAFTGPMTGST